MGRTRFQPVLPNYGLALILVQACLLGGMTPLVGAGEPEDAQAETAAPAGDESSTAGQGDLDEATRVKVGAQNMADLDRVVQLCESALAKGLDEPNQMYARQLLTATLYEKADRIGRLILGQRAPDPRAVTLRQVAVNGLTKALEYDAQLGHVHLLLARLQMLPGGDRQQASQSIASAITLLAEQPEQLSMALVVRAQLEDDAAKKLTDFDRAIELDPRNVAAWQARGDYYLSLGENEKALDNFRSLLERDPENITAHQAAAELLATMEKYDDALEHLDAIAELNPGSSVPWALRAQILASQGNLQKAIENLNEAVRRNPRDATVLLLRARLHAAKQDYDMAMDDVEKLLRLRPGLPQAVLLRSMIALSLKRFEDAIRDLRHLLRDNPNNSELKLQLATCYIADERPSKAVPLLSEVIDQETENWLAMRMRGDALLGLGRHAEAIADYERALKLRPDDSGILNNLAWVLATSPNDELRRGERAVQLATKACEVTQYQQAHILSTLAAGYAECGNFEQAIVWSTKAVELASQGNVDSDDPEQKEIQQQLKQELESYQQSKPWRELKETDEKPDPAPPDANDLESAL